MIKYAMILAAVFALSVGQAWAAGGKPTAEQKKENRKARSIAPDQVRALNNSTKGETDPARQRVQKLNAQFEKDVSHGVKTREGAAAINAPRNHPTGGGMPSTTPRPLSLKDLDPHAANFHPTDHLGHAETSLGAKQVARGQHLQAPQPPHVAKPLAPPVKPVVHAVQSHPTNAAATHHANTPVHPPGAGAHHLNPAHKPGPGGHG